MSAEADGNPNFRIRFGIGISDNDWQYCGWNLDDIKIFGYQTGLPTVANVVITRNNPTSVRLAWSQVPGATHYRIYRGDSADFEVGPGSLLIEIADPMTTYVDSDVLNLYLSAFYKITARN